MAQPTIWLLYLNCYTEIDMRNLLFWGCLATELEVAPSVRNLLRSRTEILFDTDVKSIGILPSICEAYDLYNDLEIWFNSSALPKYDNWKSIVKNKVPDRESGLWLEFCSGLPNMHVAQACLADLYPDLLSRLHIQVRFMGNLYLNGGIPWLFNTEGSLSFICKENAETVYHHFIDCPVLGTIIALRGINLKTKIINFYQTDGITISNFITNLEAHKKFYYYQVDSVSFLMMLPSE